MGTFDAPILHKVLVRADGPRVFDAMTTAEGLDSCFTSGASVDLRPGGVLLMRKKDWGPDKVTSEARCPVVEVHRPSRFVFRWWIDAPTTVEMDFQETGEGTLVSLRESGYQDSAEGHRRCLECAIGWGEALALLKFWVEHGIRY